MPRWSMPGVCAASLVTTLTVGAMPAAGQNVNPTPLRPDASVAEPFSLIRGVVELSDGRVMVADQQEVAVYVASFDGRARRALGGVGEGPEEYKSPTGLFRVGADTVLAYDLPNARYAVATPDAIVGVLTLRELGIAGSIPRAIDSMRRVYKDKVSATRILKRQHPGGAGTDRAALLRLTADRSDDTLTMLTVPGPVNPGPLPEWDVWSVAPDGWVAVVRNQDAYSVDWVAPDGRVITGAVVNEKRQTLGRADRERLGATPMPSSSFGEGGRPRRAAEAAVPDRFPFARSVRASGDGVAWVQRVLPGDAPVYDVFDRSGARIAVYRFPEGRTLVGTGKDVAYAYRVDDVGLQWLERYPLP